ncbi:MAG: hypothetical protein IKB93_04175 [Clostridia bacterium]|nr:hypothetical protein [Clostridia bacterium]
MKKFMKALALALALCMVLSVSAFAATPGSASGNTSTQVVTVTVELADTASTEQVALLIVDTAVEDSVAGIAGVAEGQIYFIDQKAATAGVATFTAPIAASVNKVDVYVGSSSLSTSGAVLLGDDVDIRVSKNITIAEEKPEAPNKVIVQPDAEAGIVQPGAAIKANVVGLGVQKMIWVLKDANGAKKYSKSVELNLNTTAVEGDVWFTGIFSSTALGSFVIDDVNAIFLGSDGNDYFTDSADAAAKEGYQAN